MKIAIIGSRNLTINNLEEYLPKYTSEIISGGAKGIDSCAKKYALCNGIKYTEFLPNYKLYGRFAPIKRNDEIINYADIIIAFWDGKSKGTKYVIDKCKQKNIKIEIYLLNK